MGNKKFDAMERFKQNCGDEYSLVSEYVNSYQPVRVRHNCKDCGYFEWPTVPKNTFLKKPLICPKCNNNMAYLKPTEYLTRDKIVNLISEDYIIKSYPSRKDLAICLQHECESCNNYQFWMSPNRYIKIKEEGKEPCPECRRMAKYPTRTKRKAKEKKPVNRNLDVRCDLGLT